MQKVLAAAGGAVLVTACVGSAIAGAYYGRATKDQDALYREWKERGLLQRAAATDPGGVLLLGDSIAERNPIAQVGGRPVFNAGIAATPTKATSEFSAKVSTSLKPSLIIIASGVNDTHASKVTPIDQWEATYTKMLATFDRTPVCVVGIMPLERKEPFGNGEFVASEIDAENKVLRRIAHARHLRFAPPLKALATIDGVHPTPEGAEDWRRAVEHDCAQDTPNAASAGL